MATRSTSQSVPQSVRRARGIHTAGPILTLVMDRSVCRRPPEAVVEAAVRSGIDRLQIRERDLDDADYLAFARSLGRAVERGARVSGHDVRIVMNRRLDLALILGSDGVHLGRGAVSIGDARALLQPLGDTTVGVSAHDIDEAKALAEAGADYIHLAPIYDPISKARSSVPLGPESLERLRDLTIPIFAQGGITAERCEILMAAGAAGVAVSGTVLAAEDPGAATEGLRRALDHAAPVS